MPGPALVLWAAAGAALSGLHWLLLVAFVARLDPESPGKIGRRIWRSYLVRYGTLALALAAAAQQSAWAAIALAVGYGVVRGALALLSARPRAVASAADTKPSLE